MELLAATDEGILRWVDGRPAPSEDGEAVTFLSRTGQAEVRVREGSMVSVGSGPWMPVEDGLRITCALALPGGGALAGTSEAHLLLAREGLERVEGFDRAEGRERWHTPWGGPPDLRSLSAGPDGAIYANVHVGGVLRSDDGGETWRPTAIPIEEDVHQVQAHPEEPEVVLAATAYGLARSEDGGASWATIHEGLEERYCRAVAVAGETVLVSASAGPGGRRAALYRLAGDRLVKEDLPDPFGGNLDTHRLAALGETAAAALPGGDLYLRPGGTWERLATGLPAVHCLLLAP